eukprot:TRINITY_DN67530_c0_g1_i1.p1 TRINITY_DN67530_c0_g1~~TRINITY_DN67530_c0_g1_i1.p1  ORF type:complete len:131 (-),score=19.09 TRINITY_DN67530_c0_g1_i1:75-467(-)
MPPRVSQRSAKASRVYGSAARVGDQAHSTKVSSTVAAPATSWDAEEEWLVRNTFNHFDLDGDGTLDVYEMKSVMSRINGDAFADDTVVTAIFRAMDKDLNDQVTIREFLDFIFVADSSIRRHIITNGQGL